MDSQRATEILSILAEGIDPITGEVFPEESPYQNVQIIRALHKAIKALKKQRSAKIIPKQEEIILSPEEEVQYSQLREWRNDLAEKLGFSPFMILHNKTIKEIIKNKAKTKEDLQTIKGIGKIKADKYGDSLVKAIAGFKY